MEIVGQLAGTATDNNYGYVSYRKVNFGFSVEEVSGAQYLQVNSLTGGSIAYYSGLKQGDVIKTIKVNDGATEDVTTKARFDEIIKGLEVGDKITLGVPRVVWPSMQTTYITMTAESFWFCNTGE